MLYEGWFDASVLPLKRSTTVAYIIRHHSGRVIYARSYRIRYIKNSQEAEAYALRCLLTYAQVHNLKSLDIFGDCRNLIEDINGRQKKRTSQEIAQKIKEIGVCRIRWVPRDQNEIADRLSRHAPTRIRSGVLV